MLVDKKNDKVKFDTILKTNEEYISVRYGYIRCIDSYGFLSMGLDGLVKRIDNDDSKILKREFPDNWNYLSKQLAYSYDDFNNLDDIQKLVNNL